MRCVGRVFQVTRRGDHRSNLDRFEEKFIPEPNSGCWLWLAALNCGYGVFGLRDGPVMRTRIASRASWMIYRGPIPPGLFVCHKCDVTSCVNPDHLYLGTQFDNMRDMFGRRRDAHSMGRSPAVLYPERVVRGSAHPLAKLDEAIVGRIKGRLREGVARKDLASEHGVSTSLIDSIAIGRKWRHVA
jgi:HNH endonuclease